MYEARVDVNVVVTFLSKVENSNFCVNCSGWDKLLCTVQFATLLLVEYK